MFRQLLKWWMQPRKPHIPRAVRLEADPAPQEALSYSEWKRRLEAAQKRSV